MSFLALFPQVQKSFFCRILYERRNFESEIFQKKLMCLVDIHNKYVKLTLITYENIQKVNVVTFFVDLTVYSKNFWKKFLRPKNMRFQLSLEQKIMSKSFLDQKLSFFEVWWGSCYSPLDGLIIRA